jgi:hypothetical protein
MPIQGKFYSSSELQKLFGVTRGRIHQIAITNGWTLLVQRSAIYCAEQVEDYLLGRGIDPELLPVQDYDHPDGATWTDRLAEAEAKERWSRQSNP